MNDNSTKFSLNGASGVEYIGMPFGIQEFPVHHLPHHYRHCPHDQRLVHYHHPHYHHLSFHNLIQRQSFFLSSLLGVILTKSACHLRHLAEVFRISLHLKQQTLVLRVG